MGRQVGDVDPGGQHAAQALHQNAPVPRGHEFVGWNVQIALGLEQRFDAYVKALAKGKDTRKLRIVIE